MRARNFRPFVDRLDSRLLLDGSGASIPDPGIDLSMTVTWNLPGSPPDTGSYDPANPPIDTNPPPPPAAPAPTPDNPSNSSIQTTTPVDPAS